MATVEAVEARRDLAGRGPAAPTAAPATFVTITGNGDSWWRSEAPAEVLGAKQIAVPGKLATRAFLQPNASTPFPWAIHMTLDTGERVKAASKAAWKRVCDAQVKYLTMTAEFPKAEGTVVWTRPDPPRAALALAMQDQGIRCLAETDDNYFADATQNLFLRQNQYGEQERLAHAKAFCVMDGIVFSTTALRDMYVKELRARMGRKNLPEMFVARNHVPGWAWPDRSERDGPLRVGFMGSSSHVWDVNLAYQAFAAAHAEGCETVMIGYNPGDPDPDLPDTLEDGSTWRTPKSAEHKRLWGKVVSKHIRWVEPEAYHRAALPLDIGLAPLRADGFTAGKSDAKALEYAISGVACVLSNQPLYNAAGWKHNVNCVMAGSPREYAEQTMRLVRDPKLRFELVSAAQEMVASERNETVMEREWREAIDG